MRVVRRPRTVGVVLLAATLLSGCAFWKNFSTYFNVLYLAQKHLEAYEETMDKPQASTNGAVAVQNHRWLDEEFETREIGAREGNPIPLQATFSRALGSTKQVTNIHLDSAIILGSKILAQRKDTKYVEDALYVVGKAQYYKNDFGGAKRKFLELLTRYPNTKYGASVQVLLSQSMLANHQLDTARSALAKAMAQAEEQGDERVKSEVHRAWAEYIYTKNLDSLSAIADELHKAEAGLHGDDLARLATEEGIVYYMNRNWDQAERAFRVASEAAHDPWLGGEAKIDRALALRRQSKFDEAIAELTTVASRAKYSSSIPAARFELARTHELAARAKVGGDLKSLAFRETWMTPLLNEYNALDTSYKNSSALIISRSKYREAEIYREASEYDSAARYAAALIGTKDFSTEAMNHLVSERMRSLAQFSKWRGELDKLDSVEASVKARRAYHNEDAQTRLKALQEVLGPRWSPGGASTLSKDDSVQLERVLARMQKERATAPRLVISDTVKFLDSLHYRASTAHFEIGRAFETFGEVPMARTEYRSSLGYHFVIPDTGKDALHARALYAWLQLEQKEKNAAVADSLLKELLTYYGQTMYAEQARRYFAVHQSADTRGESAYAAAYRTLKNSGIETAKSQFMDVVYGYEKEDVAPRALYAIGVTYEETKLYDSALTYYRRVLRDYPYSSYAVALRARMPDIAQGITRSAARPVDANSPFGTTEDPAKLEERQRQEAERARKQREEELKRQQQKLPGTEDADSTSTEVPQGQNPEGQNPPGPNSPGQLPPGAVPPGLPPGAPMPPQIGPDGKPVPPPPMIPPGAPKR